MTICEAVNPLDKYANLPGDYLDRHGYFGGFQNGTDNGYRWSAGDYYTGNPLSSPSCFVLIFPCIL